MINTIGYHTHGSTWEDWTRLVIEDLPFSVILLDPAEYPIPALVESLNIDGWRITKIVASSSDSDDAVIASVSKAIAMPNTHIHRKWDAIDDWIGADVATSKSMRECYLVQVEGDQSSQPLCMLLRSLIRTMHDVRQGIGYRFGDGTVGKSVVACIWTGRLRVVLPNEHYLDALCFRSVPRRPIRSGKVHSDQNLSVPNTSSAPEVDLTPPSGTDGEAR